MHPGSIKKVSLDDALGIIKADVPSRDIKIIVLHHFWKPTAANYKGERTMKAVRRAHRKRGWSDISYNWVCGPDGSIWTGRSLKKRGAHTIGHNSDSVGLAMCLNGDNEAVSRAMSDMVISLAAGVAEQYGMSEQDLHFHRDFADYKSCPGTGLKREEWREWLKVAMTEQGREYVRLKINDTPIRGAMLVNEDGTTRAATDHQLFFHEGRPVWIRQGESVREVLAVRGYVIPAHGWHPEQGPSGTIYAYG
jgi:hypothetical protein